jgi:hypothetical protein
MTRKKDPSKESKETGRVSPTSQSKARLIKKHKEKSPSSEIRPEITSNETDRSPHFVSSAPHDVNARIHSRAYELYERRGGHHGQDLEDWLEAERQIVSEGH